MLGVDLDPAVVDGDVPDDLHRTGLGVDLPHDEARELFGPAEVGGSYRCGWRWRAGSIPSGRSCAAHAAYRGAAMLTLLSGALDREVAAGEIEVVLGALELVGREGPGLGDDLFAGHVGARRRRQPMARLP